MLRIVLHTVPRVGRSHEHFSDGFELHLLHRGDSRLSILTQNAAMHGVDKALHGLRRGVGQPCSLEFLTRSAMIRAYKTRRCAIPHTERDNVQRG